MLRLTRLAVSPLQRRGCPSIPIVYKNGQLVATYTYDDNGNRDMLTYNNNGIWTKYDYSLANRLLTLTNKNSAGTILSQFSYNYYLNGNQASKTDQGGNTTSYTYDGLSRLKSEEATGNPAIIYTYDDCNNRKTMSAAGAFETSYDYDTNSRLKSETKVTGQVTETTSYSYDCNGNQTYTGTETIKPAVSGEDEAISLSVLGENAENINAALCEYDGFNQLIRETTGNTTVSYTYNGDGLRNTKTVNGVTITYVWDGDQIALELDGSGNLNKKYTRGINLLFSEDANGANRKYYLYNGHGDVIQLTDATGNVVKSYEYDAFGNEKNIDNNDINPFRYCGEYYDLETKTYYLRARNYDPTTGRFLSEDPARAGLNAYTYCNNNPIIFVDPYGLDAILINKPVDNAANKIGVEHMGAFFQDENDDWYFFFWGDTVQYVPVDDDSIFDSLDAMNQWLIDYRDPTDPELRLLNSDNPYRDSVYIKGDFTASHNGAQGLLDSYEKSLKTWDGKGLPNQNYNVVTNNCGQVTMSLFMQGVLDSGTNVGDYMTVNGYGTSVIPNWNMINMQSIFYNKATNLAGFEAAMQTQRNKYEGKSSFTQWWYSGLRNNINTIK